MGDEHLHARIGQIIYAAKKQLFQNLKNGADLRTAVAAFMLDLQRSLGEVIAQESEAQR
jgi:hypothetical protein